MRTDTRLTLASVCAGAVLASGAAPCAQASQAASQSEEVEAVVVTAERAGVPMWRLSRGVGTVVLVGAIERVPAGAGWKPSALQAAVAQADAVILEPEATGSVLDVGRVLLRAKRIIFLPKGETVASRYGAALDRRLAALAAAGRIDKRYGRMRAMFLSWELLDAADGSGPRAPTAVEVAERAAKTAKTPRRPVLRTSARRLIDDLSTDSPDDLRCLEAAVEAAEADQEAASRRGRAWAERRIPQVLESAIERADQACTFNRSGPIGDSVRAAWRNSVEASLARPGVVVAVAPLQTVAGPNGILDALHAQGVRIEGPRWRADQVAGQAF